MSARRHIPAQEDTELDMTPMLDIVFIMLLFFIVTTSSVRESGVKVNTPQAATAANQQNANVFIAITASGEVWIDGRPVDPRSVRAIVARLHADSPEGSVIIQSDAAAATGTLVDVMDQVRQAGRGKVALPAQPTAGVCRRRWRSPQRRPGAPGPSHPPACRWPPQSPTE